jgi:hypothetical protein
LLQISFGAMPILPADLAQVEDRAALGVVGDFREGVRQAARATSWIEMIGFFAPAASRR